MSTTVVERERVVAPQEVTKRDVLHRAADLLEEFGWTKGEMGSKVDGEFCLIGAVVEAHADMTGRPATFFDYYRHGYYNAIGCGFAWNDLHAKDKQEVVAKLREAAEA